MSELFKYYQPPYQSLVEEVRQDRVFEVYRKRPGLLAHADVLRSEDADIRTFAASVGPRFDLVDLRDAPIGMGFSLEHRKIKRYGIAPIFACSRIEPSRFASWLERLRS